MSISHQPIVPGSISLSDSSPPSPTRRSAAARSAQSRNSSPKSITLFPITTRIANPSHGQRPLTQSSKNFTGFAHVSVGQNTRNDSPCVPPIRHWRSVKELTSEDTSFSGCFGAIECAVGAHHHVFQRFVALAEHDPRTERQGYERRDNSLCGYRRLYARQSPLGEKAISTWHDHHKFFTPPTPA